MSYGSSKNRAPNVVFFDLETTGFDRPIRPVQIGAIGEFVSQNKLFTSVQSIFMVFYL